MTAATVGLIPGKPLVRTRYLRFDSLHAYCEAMKAVVGGSHLFIEGFVFSLTDAVLMLGDFVDEVDPSEGELWDPTVRGKEWIHQHARTVSSQLKAGAVVRGDSLAGEMAAFYVQQGGVVPDVGGIEGALQRRKREGRESSQASCVSTSEAQ